MSPSLLLTSATLADGSTVDVSISDGVISAIGQRIEKREQQVIDLTGYILLNSFAEPHAHLDKAFLADRIQNPAGDLAGAIKGLHEVRDTLTFEDTVSRAVRAVQLMSRNGVTSLRTHADTMLATGLQNIEALQEVKQQCASYMDMQVAMLLEWPLSGVGSAERHALARDAIQSGIDVLGGCPHLDPNPEKAIEYLVALAVEHKLPLDLHADENLRISSNDLETLADLLITQGIKIQANASHCVSLSTHNESEVRRIAEKVAEAGITVTALPQTNLFLQARGVHTLTPRGITPIALLQSCGVTVAAGADNLQDPFNTVGRGDPLEIASLLITAAHAPIESAINMVTTHAHQVVHGTRKEVSVGEKANVVAIPATTLRESIAMGPPDRIVVYGGVVITDNIRNR